MKTSLLSLQQIYFTIPSRERPILNNLCINVHSDDFIVLLGSNGSGKSSLLKIINGFLTPSSGQIYLQGKSILTKPVYTRAKSIITLSQDLSTSTFSNLSVLENCQIAMHRHKAPGLCLTKRKERDYIKSRLYDFQPSLCDKLEQTTSVLSGGERQALALAMSLWHTPSLLLLDEHTSALDPVMAEKIMELTHTITSQQKIATIMTTHRLEDALLYGNRLIALSQGNVLLDVSKEEKNALTHEKLLFLYSSNP
jgi:putative ABC transport system ATP-binding protein